MSKILSLFFLVFLKKAKKCFQFFFFFPPRRKKKRLKKNMEKSCSFHDNYMCGLSCVVNHSEQVFLKRNLFTNKSESIKRKISALLLLLLLLLFSFFPGEGGKLWSSKNRFSLQRCPIGLRTQCLTSVVAAANNHLPNVDDWHKLTPRPDT